MEGIISDKDSQFTAFLRRIVNLRIFGRLQINEFAQRLGLSFFYREILSQVHFFEVSIRM